jgi:hypothetical protein
VIDFGRMAGGEGEFARGPMEESPKENRGLGATRAAEELCCESCGKNAWNRGVPGGSEGAGEDKDRDAWSYRKIGFSGEGDGGEGGMAEEEGGGGVREGASVGRV